MSDFEVMARFRQVIMKHWIIILIVGIIFAGAFDLYKDFKGNYVVQSGDIVIGQTIGLKDYPDRNDRAQLDRLATSDTMLYSFYQATRDQFDYDKLSPGFGMKSDLDKIDWMRKHILVNDYGSGNLEVEFRLLKADAKELDYVKEHGEQYMDAYVHYLDDNQQLGNYEVLKRIAFYPDGVVISKRGVLVKYGIVGFIMGIVFAFVVLFVKELRK